VKDMKVETGYDMFLISTSEYTQKGWVMEILSFRMRAAHLPLRYVLISMRIGNEDVSPSCALMPNRENVRVQERKGIFECFFFYFGGIRMSLYLQTSADIMVEFWQKHLTIKHRCVQLTIVKLFFY
jgi:hypothetical protein